MEILTTKDLEKFKADLFNELNSLFNTKQQLPQFLNSAEVRKLFHISETKLYELRRDNKIPFIKVDWKYLYEYSEVLAAFKTTEA